MKSALSTFVPGKDLDAIKAVDLPYNQQVATYALGASQRQYAHMYAAKHLGIWAGLRRLLDWEDRVDAPLVSVGAGPLLDLIGWCLDRPWNGRKIEYDPVDWSSVRADPDWAHAVDQACGPVRGSPGVFIPGPSVPKQLAAMHDQAPLKYLPGSNLPDNAVVLLPFVLNHLLEGGSLPPAHATEMATWLKEARAKGCRIVMADIHTVHVWLWTPLLAACGVPSLQQDTLHFPHVTGEQAPLFPTSAIADYRTGRRYSQMCEAQVLVIDEGGPRFVGGTT